MAGISFTHYFGKKEAATASFFATRPYPQYPINTFDLNGGQVWQEGRCYMPQGQQKLCLIEICAAFADSNWGACQSAIAELQNAGGEFAVWILLDNRLLFFNDGMGRLPVYSSSSTECLFIGRSIQRFFEQGRKEPDLLGLAQYMWAGYSIGDRTIFNSISVVAPGTIWALCLSDGTTLYHTKEQPCFSDRNSASIYQNADALASCLIEACCSLRQSQFQHFHLSLSGGQDSRAVLSAALEADMPLSCSSFLNSGAERDVALASKMAAIKGVSWFSVPVGAGGGSDEWLLNLKSGLNYAAMSFIGTYLKEVAASVEEGTCLLTGDGGDYLLPFNGEVRTVKSLDELVSILMVRHAITPASLAAKIFGLSGEDIAHSVHKLVSSYPEATFNDRSIHFALVERMRRAFFEGEDRNRFFLWSTSPFFYPPFVRLAMQVPDDQKKTYKLYHQLQKRLSPAIALVPDAGGGRLGSLSFQTRKWVREHFRSSQPAYKNALRYLYTMMQNPANGEQYLSIPIPAALGPVVDDEAWQQLLRSKRTEACRYLYTISKVF